MKPDRPSYSAALLAGGQSTRMGRDKALLTVPGSGLLLWQRQLGILERLQPEKIFWSGSVRPGVPTHVEIVPDIIKEGGPLAGISACLEHLQSDLLVVLAVDLPRMEARFLQRLLATCTSPCGAAVQRGDFYEPLAAVYPKTLAPLAMEHLQAGRLALQDFVRQAVKNGALQVVTLKEQDFPLFQNVNRPEDWLAYEKDCNESGGRSV